MTSKNDLPSVTFFVLVTQRDAGLARFCLRSLRRLSDLDISYKIIIYLNGVSVPSELKLQREIERLENATLRSNRLTQHEWNPFIPPGNVIRSGDGIYEVRHGPYESGAEIWTRELPSAKTDFVCQMDGDFEILSSDFIWDMYELLRHDSSVAVVSTAYTPRIRDYFDSYSNETFDLSERAHTWCAMWRRQATAAEEGFWFRSLVGTDGRRVSFDHGAYLQAGLRERGFKTIGLDTPGGVLAERARLGGLHYGAFSNNRSLRGFRLRIYRTCRIAIHDGWFHWHGNLYLARVIRFVGLRVFNVMGFRSADEERTRYPYE